MRSRLDMGNRFIYNVETPVNNDQGANNVDQKVTKSGDTMSGGLNMENKKIINLANPTDDKDAVNKKYVNDNYSSSYGSNKMEGPLNMNDNRITGLTNVLYLTEATNKQYVDNAITNGNI